METTLKLDAYVSSPTRTKARSLLVMSSKKFMNKKFPPFNFGSPIFSFFAFYFVFHIFKLVYYYLNNIFPDGLDFYIFDNIILLCFVILSLIIYFLHMYLFRSYISSSTYNSGAARVTINVNVLYFTVGSMILLIALGFNSGVFPWNDPLRFREVIQGNGGAYFLIIYLFFLKASGCYFFDSYINKSIVPKDYLFVFIFILFSFMSGFASLFIHFFIAGFIYVSAKYRKRIISIKVLLLFSFLILITPFYNVLRYAIKDGADLTDALQTFIQRYDFDFLSMIVNRFDYLDNSIIASKYFREIADPSLIFNIIFQPVPRSWMENKPYNYTTLATSLMFPDNLEIGATNNFGFLGEFLLYFGDTGLLLGCLFFSILLLITLHKYLYSFRSTRKSLFYVLILSSYFSSFVGGYFNDLPLPTLIVDFFLWHLFKRYLFRPENS